MAPRPPRPPGWACTVAAGGVAGGVAVCEPDWAAAARPARPPCARSEPGRPSEKARQRILKYRIDRILVSGSHIIHRTDTAEPREGKGEHFGALFAPLYYDMPEKKTIERARRDAREGKAPTTQAGEFVREEFEHIRKGKHGAKNTKQAIAIGLSKARRAGVKLPPPPAKRRKAS